MMDDKERIKAAMQAMDDSMEMICNIDSENNIAWLSFYIGKAWAYLDTLRGGEDENRESD